MDAGKPFGGFFVIAGPCMAESLDLCMAVARHCSQVCERLGVGYTFKASFDKANRTSSASFRGPGLVEGLAMLKAVKDSLGLPVLTDIHLPDQAAQVAEVVDILQIPAFLCRQTDLLEAAGRTGKPVNVKKGQFASPVTMREAVAKVRSVGNSPVLLTERGTTFGYGDLIVDMRSIPLMRETGCPVVIDATHSVQKPSALGNRSGGDRSMITTIALAAVAAGADGLFVEVHPEPDNALSDGPNSLPLEGFEPLLASVLEVHRAVSRR